MLIASVDVMKELCGFIFRVKQPSKAHFIDSLTMKNERTVTGQNLCYYIITSRNSIKSQKTWIFSSTAVRTSYRLII